MGGSLSRRPSKAARPYNEAMTGTPDPLERARSALEAQAFERALTAAEAALDDADPQTAYEARRLAVQAAYYLGRREDALRHALVEVRVAGELGDADKEARAHNDLAAVYGSGGLDDKAVEHLWQALERLEPHGGASAAGPLNNLGNVYVQMGRADEAGVLFARAASAYRAAGDAAGEALARANVGRALVAAGRPEEAVPELDAALEAFERMGRLGDVAATHAKLGDAHAAADRAHRARPAFERALELHAQGHGRPFEVDTRHWFGRWLLHEGEAAEAQTHLERAEALAAGESAFLARTGLLEDLARALEGQERYRDGMAALWRHLAARQAAAQEGAELRARLRLMELEIGAHAEGDVARSRAVELERANRELRAQAQRLEQLSTTDELTGLRNRRALDRRLEEEAARAMRYVRPLVLALMDLDGFKAINDRFSHEVGDEVLREVGRLLARRLRASDVAARWGGEEFALLLPDTELEDAVRVLDGLRVRLAELPWHELHSELSLTASIGAAALEEVDELPDLLRLADRRLYAAKQQGRNRVVTSGRFEVTLS